MSHSRFHLLRLVLRHAWLNLWDKHMTTGRINQVARLFKQWDNHPKPHRGEEEAATELSVRGPTTSQRAQGPPNNQQISQTVRQQFISQSKEKRATRSESRDHKDVISITREGLTYGYMSPCWVTSHAAGLLTLLTNRQQEERLRTSNFDSGEEKIFNRLSLHHSPIPTFQPRSSTIFNSSTLASI